MSLRKRLARLRGHAATAMAGKPWSDEEECRLLESLQQGLPVEEIALHHQRTPNGIYARAYGIAREMAGCGKTPEEISEELNISLRRIRFAVS